MHTRSATRLTPSGQLDCSAESQLSRVLKCISHHTLPMLLTCEGRRGHFPALFLQKKPKQKLWRQQCVLSHRRLRLLLGESQLDFHPAFTSKEKTQTADTQWCPVLMHTQCTQSTDISKTSFEVWLLPHSHYRGYLPRSCRMCLEDRRENVFH